jgi:branched-chain amino acid transport system permease protein
MIKDSKLRKSIKFGAYGGLAALYIAVIGMLMTFAERDVVSEFISVGQSMLIIAVLAPSYLASRQGTKGRAFLYGGIAGLVVGAILALFLLIASRFNIGFVLFNVTDELIQFLSFGQSSSVGAGLLILFGTGFGLVSSILRVMPDRIRRPLLYALISLTFAGMMSNLLRISITEFSKENADRLVTGNGLTVFGGWLAFLVVGIYTAASMQWADSIRSWRAGLPPTQSRILRYVLLLLAFGILAYLPWLVGKVVSDVLVLVGIYIMMGFGLNIVVGKAGLLDLGYVAFFAVGAYTTAILTSPRSVLATEMTFWQALPFVIIFTGIAGLLVGAPVLRMRGDYLAIVTLGFGEIARFLFLSDWLKPWLGGAQGIIRIPPVMLGSLELKGPQYLYYLVLGGSLIALFISWRIEKSRIGRAWVAMREDEEVAETMGINTTYFKLLAFAMGAMIASIGGAIFAVKLSAIFPHSFNVEVSITALSLLIIGGIGSLPGVVVGAFALVGIPELLREFSEFRLLLYGATIIIMMIVRPEGLIPSKRRSRELHDAEKQQDAWVRAEDGDKASKD